MYGPPEMRVVGTMRMLLLRPDQLGIITRPISADMVDPIELGELVQSYGTEIYGGIDGPMFSPCGDAFSAQCARPDYGMIDTRRSVSMASQNPHDGMTISTFRTPFGGRAVATRGFAPALGATVAVQLYPSLVWNGEVQDVAESPLDTRAGLAIMQDGRLALVISQQMTMAEFADALVSAGAVYAGYTDGGSSTAMAEMTGTHGGERPVAVWLVAERYNLWSTRKKVAVGLTTAAVIGGLVYAYQTTPEFRRGVDRTLKKLGG